MTTPHTFEFESRSHVTAFAICGFCHAVVVDDTVEKMAHRRWHEHLALTHSHPHTHPEPGREP